MSDQVAARLQAALVDQNAMSDAELQDILTSAVRLYAARADERPVAPFVAHHAVTANDVMITVTEMLRAVNVQVFELSMWQSLCGMDGIPAKNAEPGDHPPSQR